VQGTAGTEKGEELAQEEDAEHGQQKGREEAVLACCPNAASRTEKNPKGRAVMEVIALGSWTEEEEEKEEEEIATTDGEEDLVPAGHLSTVQAVVETGGHPVHPRVGRLATRGEATDATEAEGSL